MTVAELFNTINERGLRLTFRDSKPVLEPSERVDDTLRKALEMNAASLTPLAHQDDTSTEPARETPSQAQALETILSAEEWSIAYAIATCRLWHLIRVCAHDETRLRLVQIADFVPGSEQEWLEHRSHIDALENDIMRHGRWPGLPCAIVKMFG